MKQIFIFFLAVLVTSNKTVQAQEHTLKDEAGIESSEHSNAKAHRLTLSMGHTHIRKGLEHHESFKGIYEPSWLLDYDYWLSNRIAIGLHSDVVIDNFEVEAHLNDKEEVVLKRSNPVAIVPVASFKAWKNAVLQTGMGGEFAPEGNFWLLRAGIEYGFHMPKNWELSLSTTYDLKLKNYDSWTFGVGVSKWFKKHHAHHG